MSHPTEFRGTSSSFQFDASAPSFVPRAQLNRTVSWASRVRSGPPPPPPKATPPPVIAEVVQAAPAKEQRPARPMKGPAKSLADIMKPPATLSNLDKLSAQAGSEAKKTEPSGAATVYKVDEEVQSRSEKADVSKSEQSVDVADDDDDDSSSSSSSSDESAPVDAGQSTRKVYTVEEMYALKDNEECRVLLDRQDLPEWALNSAGDGSRFGINTLLEYGRNAASKNVDMKYQMPAALTRKLSPGQSTAGAKDIDWTRRAPLQRAKTADRTPGSISHSGPVAALPELPNDSWQVQQQKDKDDGDRGTKVLRRLRAQLNKMTPKTYEQIFKAILDIGIQNVSEAGGFVNLIFEKAITNHKYLDMYADLCGELELELQKRGVFCSADEKDPAFKRLLIKQCQDTFKNYLAADFVAPPDADEEEAFEMLLLHKKKMKGNLMFVACLAQSQLIKPKILLVILNETLDTKKPLQLEALASFLPSCAPAVANTKRGPAFFEYLDRCRRVAEDADVDQRVRFLLLDAITQIDKMKLRRD